MYCDPFSSCPDLIVGNFPLILNTNPKGKEQVVCSYDHTVGMKPYAVFQLPRFLIMFFMFRIMMSMYWVFFRLTGVGAIFYQVPTTADIYRLLPPCQARVLSTFHVSHPSTLPTMLETGSYYYPGFCKCGNYSSGSLSGIAES